MELAVEGRNVAALVDSGATHNVLRVDIAKMLGWKEEDQGDQFILADGACAGAAGHAGSNLHGRQVGRQGELGTSGDWL